MPFFNRATADMYRSIFKFGVFNAVQSGCFDTVCAPLIKAGERTSHKSYLGYAYRPKYGQNSLSKTLTF